MRVSVPTPTRSRHAQGQQPHPLQAAMGAAAGEPEDGFAQVLASDGTVLSSAGEREGPS